MKLDPQTERLVREAIVVGFAEGTRWAGYLYDDDSAYPKDSTVERWAYSTAHSYSDLYPLLSRVVRDDRTKLMRNDGLSEGEGLVMDLLVEAAKAYGRLPQQHPDEPREFIDALHRCQDQLATRACRRVFPQGWPNYSRGAKAPLHPEAAHSLKDKPK